MAYMIDPKQIKIIHTAISKLDLSDDEYRDILLGHFKASSCTDLTYIQASNLIDYFKTLGFKIPRRKKYTKGTSALQDHYPLRRDMPPNVFVLPTRDQLKMIDALAGQITWKFEDGFQRWMKKFYKIDRITKDWEASTVIEGLKKLLEHQQPCEAKK
ncbi:MAG: regulatory protein GemA [Victivallales bacterium]|jgi:hypothetical protein